MLDIVYIRENSELVKDNIIKRVQDAKLPLVDEVLELDAQNRAAIREASDLRASRNALSKQIGMLMGQAKKAPSRLEEAEAIKAQVKVIDARLTILNAMVRELSERIHAIMLQIPNMIDPSVPLGPDDSYNVEVERFGEPGIPAFELPHYLEIMERFQGIDFEAAGRYSKSGFYFLIGDVARLHSAVLAYTRDFMINKGFTYCIPPAFIRSNVVENVLNRSDMEARLYKIEGENLYLNGTSGSFMTGKFTDQIIPEETLPQTLAVYSPCFQSAHGIHQCEKQEMIIICKPEDATQWYEKMWRYNVELFRNIEIPVRQLACCSGTLEDMENKACHIEAWSPRQQKYFGVCSCSDLKDALARRLRIRVKREDGKIYLPYTMNSTVIILPKILIALLENHLQEDGSVTVPEVLWPYMGGAKVLKPKA